MTDKFKFDTRVKLVSFHGEIKPSEPVNVEENYWVLVGHEGQIVSQQPKIHPAFRDKGERVLVKFDQNLSDIGLVNHNDITNALWVFISDLETSI